MDSHEDIDPTESWVQGVGNFITSFAYLEQLTYESYDLLGVDPVVKYGRNQQNYTARDRMLQALLRSSDLEAAARLEELIEHTFSLAKTRNQIAHNPLMVNVYMEVEGKEHYVEPRFHSSRNGEELSGITQSELEDAQARLGEVAHEMRRLLSAHQHASI